METITQQDVEETLEKHEFPSVRTMLLAEDLRAKGYPLYLIAQYSHASIHNHLREDELFDLMRFIVRHWQRPSD